MLASVLDPAAAQTHEPSRSPPPSVTPAPSNEEGCGASAGLRAKPRPCHAHRQLPTPRSDPGVGDGEVGVASASDDEVLRHGVPCVGRKADAAGQGEGDDVAR